MHDRARFWSPVPDWSQVSLHAPGIDVAPLTSASLCLVSGNYERLLARNNVNEIHGPRQVCDRDTYVLRLAPDRLLYVGASPTPSMPGETASVCAITDISDGMLIFDVRGEGAAELMAQGSEYPFHDVAVLPLESASMQFAGFRLIVSRRAHGWRLHIERPWATALWRWLQAHVE
jgi:sarcosine oxidase gamma subunit